jgi:hypothetical protein
MKKFIKKLLDGMVMGLGFTIFCLVIGGFIFYFFADFKTKASVRAKLEDKGFVEEVVQEPDSVPSTVKRAYISPPLETPQGYEEIWVSDSDEFIKAMKKANEQGFTAVILEQGNYKVKNTIYVKAEHIMVKSATGNPYDVTLEGTGMAKGGKVKGIFRVNSNYFTLDGVTLTDVPNHLVQVAGEINASYPHFRHVIFQDSYEQMLKVSYNYKTKESQKNRSIGGIVEGCIFQYTKGIGPNYYIGGVDALGAVNWTVKNSIFRDIASPKGRISQHAVHFWDNSEDNIVVDNIFIDNDRAIGFGMRLRDRGVRFAHRNGVAKGNVIYHTNNGDPFADVGIVAEGNLGLTIEGNHIYQMHPYANAIEFRWDNSTGIEVRGNATNKSIQSRDGADALLELNNENLSLDDFLIKFQVKSDSLNVADYKQPLQGQ